MRHRLIFFALLVMALPLHGQRLVPAGFGETVNSILDHGSGPDSLDCSVDPIKPFLDFEFRFGAGYQVACPIRIFEGRSSRLRVIARVTPSGHQAIILADTFNVSGYDGEASKKPDFQKVKTEFELSGLFLTGEGQYSIDLLLIDDHLRTLHKHWTAVAELKRNERNVAVTIPANTALPLHSSAWSPVSDSGPGKRVTILLDATPVNPRGVKLRSIDRAFLLQALLSVLKELNPGKVRLVAFNLDQQRELFRKDDFGGEDFFKLDDALRQLELATVSYRTLQDLKGGSTLLAGLVNKETAAADSSDAVVFLGPTTHFTDRLPKDLVQVSSSVKTRFFYLEFYPYWRMGNEFPDAVQHAVAQCDGTTLKIHSPAELAQEISKLKAQLETQYEAQTH